MKHQNGKHPYRKRVLYFLVLLLLFAVGGQAIYLYIQSDPKHTNAQSDKPDTPTVPDSTASIQDEVSEPAEDTVLESATDSVISPTENTIEPDTDITQAPAADDPSGNVSGTSIDMEESTGIEEEFTFENTLFIGDSRTEGLFINTGLTDATFYAVRGLAVDNIYTKQFIREEGHSEKLTVMEALEEHSYRKIYLMLGVNELGWAYEDIFIDRYTELVEDIQELQPDAEIVVQSILPVTSAKSNSDDIYNNTKIYRYNELIQTMTEEKEITYADLVPAFAGEDGALPAEGAVDGIHLTKSYYQKWLDYLTDNRI